MMIFGTEIYVSFYVSKNQLIIQPRNHEEKQTSSFDRKIKLYYKKK